MITTPVSTFLNKQRNPGTRRKYGKTINRFLNFAYLRLEESASKGPDDAGYRFLTRKEEPQSEVFEMVDATGSKQTFSRKVMTPEPEDAYKKRIGDMLDLYLSSLQDEGMTPGTVTLHYHILKSWFTDNDVELKPSTLRTIAKRYSGDITVKDEKPPIHVLQAMLSDMRAKQKGLYGLLATSGMRPGEARHLTTADFKIDQRPVRIDLKPEYVKGKKYGRTTFITDEVAEWVLPFLDQSDPSKRVFLDKKSDANHVWESHLTGLGFDQKSHGVLIYHLYTLRKWFRSTFRIPLSPEGHDVTTETVETLMGHRGYLTKNYLRIPEDELRARYKLAEPSLAIFKVPEFKAPPRPLIMTGGLPDAPAILA